MLKKLPIAQRNVVLIFLGSCISLAFLVAQVIYPPIDRSHLTHIVLSMSTSANLTPSYYGETMDMSQILPASLHYVVNTKGLDLIDIAANLGINLVRITNAQRSFNNNQDSLYTHGQWNQVLNKMQRKGIKALILIETASSNRNYYAPEIHQVYLDLVQQYISSDVFSNPDVFAVDIKNEPLITAANLRMLDAAHTMIKAKYPDLKQTVGWWAAPKTLKNPYNRNNYLWSDYAVGQKLNSIVDFYSIHMYGLDSSQSGIYLNPDLTTKAFVSAAVNGLQTQKPILIEEFGEANGDAVSDQNTIGSPQLQANVYQGVYQALHEMQNSQILGAVAFDFSSRNQFPDAWSIVKNQGNYLFPAALILQEYALGKLSSTLQATTVVTSQSYLLTDASNHTIINLLLSDRIGLKLHLNHNASYAISLTISGILQPREYFHYETASNSYSIVYQAVRIGSVQLTITLNTNCINGAQCTLIVYTVTINVQAVTIPHLVPH